MQHLRNIQPTRYLNHRAGSANMVNGNYVLYGDRPSSGSDVLDEHTQTTERKFKRKFSKASEHFHSQQRRNETDSLKYEKAKEPRLLRYVPTTDVEEHYVTETFETYDLKPSEELPHRPVYTKKPKNSSDRSPSFANSRSSSNCSSPSTNLPPIAEYGENRLSRTSHRNLQPEPLPEHESKLEKFFCNTRVNDFPKGSHPDTLYRLPTHTAGGAERALRVLRLLRWPIALVCICVALAIFVYFLIPYKAMVIIDEDFMNGTEWETHTVAASVGGHHFKAVHRPKERISGTKSTEIPHNQVTDSKTSEIDYYESDKKNESDKKYIVTDIKKFPDGVPANQWPIKVKPVYPDHITPEVQYGADEHMLRNPKLLEDKRAMPQMSDEYEASSTVKPHITISPEIPSAIEPHIIQETDQTKLENFESRLVNATSDINATTRTPDIEITDNRWYLIQQKTKQSGRNLYSNGPDETKPSGTTSESVSLSNEEKPIEIVSSNVDLKFTSGHSKIFGISIEDMQSTTQSSTHNTRVSPTLPTLRDRDDTTKKYPTTNSDVSQCRSTRLHLCRGVLPYDLASSPELLNGEEITTYLPQIEYLVTTNCSNRLRQFFCALLEPECSAPAHSPKLPCYNLCQAIRDSCEDFLPQELISAFNCRQYTRDSCVAARAPCTSNEFMCEDGTCILQDWVCDGTLDCSVGEDEKQCSACTKTEFSCESGGCIAKQWLCDGYRDCPGGEDELETTCKGRLVESGHIEPGEDTAGSAPAPTVRRANRLADPRKGGQSYKIEESDSSKELLMTSDSSDGLKRNFMRRPSPSRLTPYTPKLRQKPQSDVSTEETVANNTDKSQALEEAPQTTQTSLVIQQEDKSLVPLTGVAIVNSDKEGSYFYPDYARSYTSHSSPCPAGELRCVDGRCITFSQLCDGVVDCTDNADENNCNT